MSGLDNPGGPDADTPLNAAWRRVVKLARAAGAISTTGNYQADIDADRSLAQSFGFALGYGVEGEDVMQLLDYGIALQADAIVHGTHPLNAFASVASMFLFTGMEFKTSPLEEAPPAGVVLETHENEPPLHKRDVLVRMLQDPHRKPTADSILNELHQNGWKVVPK
jgi:hypothetical protein